MLQDMTKSRLFKYDSDRGEVIRHSSGRCIVSGVGEGGILCAQLHEKRPFKEQDYIQSVRTVKFRLYIVLKGLLQK